MSRTGVLPLIVSLALVPATPALASDRIETTLIAPLAAGAEAWAREDQTVSSSKTLSALQVSYAGLQGLDMWSTLSRAATARAR